MWHLLETVAFALLVLHPYKTIGTRGYFRKHSELRDECTTLALSTLSLHVAVTNLDCN